MSAKGLSSQGAQVAKSASTRRATSKRFRSVMRLTNDLGVNLAGAEAILYMRERMIQLRQEMEQLRREMEAQIAEFRQELDIDSRI